MPRSGWKKITLTWVPAPQISALGRGEGFGGRVSQGGGTELAAKVTKVEDYSLARLSPLRARIFLFLSCFPRP